MSWDVIIEVLEDEYSPEIRGTGPATASLVRPSLRQD